MANSMAGNTGFRTKKKEKEAKAEAWVEQGDQEQEERSLPKNENVKTKLLLHIPTSLHAEFKLVCKERGYTMAEELRKMIEEYVRTNKRKINKK